MKMKRFLVFGCDSYYPLGDLRDLLFVTNDFVEIKNSISDEGYEYITVLDSKTGATYFRDTMRNDRIRFWGYIEDNGDVVDKDGNKCK